MLICYINELYMNIYAACIGVLVFLFLAYCVSTNILFVYGCIITTILIKCIRLSSRKSPYTMNNGLVCMRKAHMPYNKIGGGNQDYDYYQYMTNDPVPAFRLPAKSPYEPYNTDSTSGYIHVNNTDCAFIRKLNKESNLYTYYIEYPREDPPDNKPLPNKISRKTIAINKVTFCKLLKTNNNNIDTIFKDVPDETFPKVVDMEYTYVDAPTVVIPRTHSDLNRLDFNNKITIHHESASPLKVQGSKGQMRYNPKDKKLTITDAIFGERITNIVQEREPVENLTDKIDIYSILKRFITDGFTSLTYTDMVQCINAVNDNTNFTTFAIVHGILGDLMRTLNNNVFCLPSQLNAAEYTSETSIVESLSEYLDDGTGGPAGQLAGDPGVAQFIIDNAENANSNGKGINNVRELLKQVNTPNAHKQLILQNGYLLLQENGKINKYSDTDVGVSICEKFGEHLHLMKLLIAQNVMMCGINRTVDNMARQVDIAYASAMPYNNYRNDEIRKTHTNSRILAIMVIYGQINLLLQYARTCSKNVVILPLGGGVFCNIRSDILLAILTASANQQRFGGYIPDIKLLCYSNSEKLEYDGYYTKVPEPAVAILSAGTAYEYVRAPEPDRYYRIYADSNGFVQEEDPSQLYRDYTRTPNLNKPISVKTEYVAIVKLYDFIWAVFKEILPNYRELHKFNTKPNYYILKNHNIKDIKCVPIITNHQYIDTLLYVPITCTLDKSDNYGKYTYKYTITDNVNPTIRQKPFTRQILAYLHMDGDVKLQVPYMYDKTDPKNSYIIHNNDNTIYEYKKITIGSVVFLLPSHYASQTPDRFEIRALTTNTKHVTSVLESLNQPNSGVKLAVVPTNDGLVRTTEVPRPRRRS